MAVILGQDIITHPNDSLDEHLRLHVFAAQNGVDSCLPSLLSSGIGVAPSLNEGQVKIVQKHPALSGLFRLLYILLFLEATEKNYTSGERTWSNEGE